MEQLIHRIQFHNDEMAFNQLYQQNVVKIFQFAYSFVKEKEIAEEIVNDVFVRLWLDRAKLDKIRNLTVYLYVAVKNASLNYLNRVSSRKNSFMTAYEQSFELFVLQPNPEQLMIGKQMKLSIDQAVNQLPPRCRVIFKMIREDNLTANEVAQILEISNKTVFAQLSIAIKKLEELVVKETKQS
ncbi:MAG: RNA polymerase sigma-70 factor [Pedobacter sp.]|uniref:RNA polymerase sigma-70 factor n=1 Tax=Pedobacter sp. TaxID=1411316 RepID=UPI0033937F71